MTDREIIEKIMEKTKNTFVVKNDNGTFYEYSNTCIGENIVFEFDEKGNILKVFS